MTATAELALAESVIDDKEYEVVDGIKKAWLVEPEFKTVTVYQSPRRNTILTEDEELTSAVLPGFCCDLREIFSLPARPSASALNAAL